MCREPPSAALCPLPTHVGCRMLAVFQIPQAPLARPGGALGSGVSGAVANLVQDLTVLAPRLQWWSREGREPLLSSALFCSCGQWAGRILPTVLGLHLVPLLLNLEDCGRVSFLWLLCSAEPVPTPSAPEGHAQSRPGPGGAVSGVCLLLESLPVPPASRLGGGSTPWPGSRRPRPSVHRGSW